MMMKYAEMMIRKNEKETPIVGQNKDSLKDRKIPPAGRNDTATHPFNKSTGHSERSEESSFTRNIGQNKDAVKDKEIPPHTQNKNAVREEEIPLHSQNNEAVKDKEIPPAGRNDTATGGVIGEKVGGSAANLFTSPLIKAARHSERSEESPFALDKRHSERSEESNK